MLSANILPIMSKAPLPHKKHAIMSIAVPQHAEYVWDMKKTFFDLYAHLPKVLKSLIDDVGILGEQYSASLNDFVEYCHTGHRTDGRLKTDAAWETYSNEWSSWYSRLAEGFHVSLNQLLVRDFKARCELLAPIELSEELKPLLHEWCEIMVMRSNAHLKRLQKLAGERSLDRIEALMEQRARMLSGQKE